MSNLVHKEVSTLFMHVHSGCYLGARLATSSIPDVVHWIKTLTSLIRMLLVIMIENCLLLLLQFHYEALIPFRRILLPLIVVSVHSQQAFSGRLSRDFESEVSTGTLPIPFFTTLSNLQSIHEVKNYLNQY